MNWGIMGAARIAAGNFVPAIRGLDDETLLAVASRDEQKAGEFAATHEIPRAFGDYDALLHDQEIEAIYLALPNALHAKWSIRALEAGKHVLCEKPLATSEVEVRQMFEVARKTGKTLGEVFNYRFHPLTQQALEVVQSGEIGELRMMRALFSAKCDDFGDIRFAPELGGGALFDLGCYCIGVLRLMAQSEPKRLVAHQVEHPGGVDWRCGALLEFEDGLLGDFSCGYGVPFACSFELIGTRGRLLVDEGAMVAWPGSDFCIKVWAGDNYREIAVPATNNSRALVAAFCEAAQNGVPFPISPEDSLGNARVIDQIREAMR